MKKNKSIPQEFKEKLLTLTKKEQHYFKCMWPKSGVVFLTSKPGVAKSAILSNIAEKMGFAYHDVRLAMVDETDVGLYPSISEHNGIKCLDFVVPRWAMEANDHPTIIHFEELNRATQQVRNAALQIFLERGIGTRFKFNDNVLMIASGNLGEEDGTDVEEFDSALNGRLIHIKHSLSKDEWVDGFAEENVHPIIVSFINSNPECLYQNPNKEDTKAYASPRTWTFLSDYIVSNFGMESSPKEFMDDLLIVAGSYIGATAKKFVTYCHDKMNIGVEDILNRYDEIKDDLLKYNRDKNSELIQDLKNRAVEEMTKSQLINLTKFLRLISEDELTSYLLGVLTNIKPVEGTIKTKLPKTKAFLKQFDDALTKTLEINNRNQEAANTTTAE